MGAVKRLRALLLVVAFRQLRESQRCWGEAYDLQKQGLAGCVQHRLLLIGAHIYLLRACLLGLDKSNADWWRDFLNKYSGL